MIHNFNGKKDVETAAESLIFNTAFSNNILKNKKSRPTASVTSQHVDCESFDNAIEKKQ
jgi:hypothetical protein